MITTVAQGSLAILGLAMLAALYRIYRGPSIADRVVATDLLTTCIMAAVVVASLLLRTRVYIDLVMVLAVLGFFGTVAFAKYILGGRAID